MNKKDLVLLTGANGQLGKAIINLMSKDCVDFIGVDITIEQSGVNFLHFVNGDITDESCLDQFLGSIPSDLSIYKSLSLVNNAGVTVFSPSEDRTYDEFKFVSDLNIWAPLLAMTKFSTLVATILQGSESSSMKFSCVNISSIYGLVTPNPSLYSDTPRNSSEIYGASKAALNQLTRYFAARYAKSSISINGICPGGVLNPTVQGPEFIKTYSSLVPMDRLCYEDEVASLVKYLCVDRPDYLTGQVIALDGGLTSW